MKSIQTEDTKFKGELIPFKTGLRIVEITLVVSWFSTWLPSMHCLLSRKTIGISHSYTMRSSISSFIVIGHGSRTHGSFTASIYLVLIWFLSSGRIRTRKCWTEIRYWLIALNPDQVFVSVTATQMILVRWPWPSLNSILAVMII